jgi:hypothetical protein
MAKPIKMRINPPTREPLRASPRRSLISPPHALEYSITLEKLSLARLEAWQGGHDRKDFLTTKATKRTKKKQSIFVFFFVAFVIFVVKFGCGQCRATVLSWKNYHGHEDY